jgi:hypothetical protein
MTRLGFRSPGLALAITGTALVGLTPTTMSPFIVRTRTITAAVALLDNDALLTGASLSI